MEESSNGRLEETQKVKANDDEEKEIGLEDSAASKPEVAFVRDIIDDGNSESINEKPNGEDSDPSSSNLDGEAEPEERSAQVENSVNFEKEKVVPDSAVESVELEPGVSLTEEFGQDIDPSVDKLGDPDVAKLDTNETEVIVSPSLNETIMDSPILTDLLINGPKEGIEQLSSAEAIGDSALLEDVKSKGTDEEKTIPGIIYETNSSMLAADVMSRGIEETTSSCLAESGGVSAAAVPQAIRETAISASDSIVGGSSGSPDLAPKKSAEDSLQESNVPTVENRDAGELVNKPEVHESTGNQPIISLNRRPTQPTSWKSCCGLFEVLRRSDR